MVAPDRAARLPLRRTSHLNGSQPRIARSATATRLAPRSVATQLHSSTALFIFFGVEIACQLALLLPSISALRIIVRTAAFGMSLIYLALLRGNGPKHPAATAAFLIVGVLVLEVFHPETNSIPSGVAELALNMAIVAPLFWVRNIRIDVKVFDRLMLMLWAFNFASATLGALQVYFPGRFQPAMASVMTDSALQGLKITLASGQQVYRPMGLTDAPGGAGIGAMYTVLFAAGLLLSRPNMALRILLFASMAVGCFTLYLCQVRSLLVMLIISLSSLALPFFAQRKLGRLFAIMVPLAIIAVLSFTAAVAIGGDSVTNRLGTLIADDPRAVYYTNRGISLQYTFTDLLPQYPLGAGLGRWGMIYNYFSDHSAAAPRMIWAEVQWTGWLLDGGVPFMLIYLAAIWIGLRECFRATMERNDDLQKWAAVIAGHSIGIAALTFNSVPFIGTGGVNFWILVAAIFAARAQERQELVRRAAADEMGETVRV
jgi:hypothetical protein